MSEKKHAEVIIYNIDFCPYCTRAKQLLESKGVKFKEINVTEEPREKRVMIEKSGRKTFPQIFIDGEHVGGFDDINALDRDGKLNKMLHV